MNVRDEKNTAEAFERSFNVTYPSFKDVTGKVLLSLSKYVPAQAVPTTVILDEKGAWRPGCWGRLIRPS